MARFSSKISFLNNMPMLIRATSDDSTPTPGYLYKEINHLTLGPAGHTAALLDFLVSRLDIQSCYVKLKVMNIMKHLIRNGHPDFAGGLRRRASGINQAINNISTSHLKDTMISAITTCVGHVIQSMTVLYSYSLPTNTGENQQHCYPKCIRGMQYDDTDLSAILYDIEGNSNAAINSRNDEDCKMGASRAPMQGFGNSLPVQERTITDSIMNGFHQIASSFTATELRSPSNNSGRVYKAMQQQCANNSSTNSKSTYKGALVGNVCEVASIQESTKSPASAHMKIAQNADISSITYKGGKVGGGWIEDGTSSSGHSDGSVPLTEKLESVIVEDWIQEAKCVEDIIVSTEGRLIPSRQELDQLERRCNTLNCDQVLGMLMERAAEQNNTTLMRALCAIERLLSTDLLEHVNDSLQPTLQNVSTQKSSKQAVSKAKKILRQIQSTVRLEEVVREATPLRLETPPATLMHLETLPASEDHQFVTDKNETVVNLRTNFEGVPVVKEEIQPRNKSPVSPQFVANQSADSKDGEGQETVSFFDGLMFKIDSGDELNRISDISVDSQTMVNSDILQLDSLDVNAGDYATSKIVNSCINDSHTHISIADRPKTISSISKEETTSSISKERVACKEVMVDPLLSKESCFSALLSSLKYEVEETKVTESENVGTVANQVPVQLRLPSPPLSMQTISTMFPQLASSNLSGTSAVPLQLSKTSGSFGFIVQSQTDTKMTPETDKFDMVKEAMKSALAK